MLLTLLKRILRLDRLRLWGLSRARNECTLATVVQDLRRLAVLVPQGWPVQCIRVVRRGAADRHRRAGDPRRGARCRSDRRDGFSRFCRALSIKSTGKAQAGRVNVPVGIGDMSIRPGDLIACDRNGIVVVDPDEAAQVVTAARARKVKEAGYRAAIAKGTSTMKC